MTRGGWYNESYRHRLAARGIKTTKYLKRKSPAYYQQKLEAPILNRIGANIQDVDESEVRNVTAEAIRRYGVPGTSRPSTATERIRGGERLVETTADIIRKRRPVQVALDAAERGQFTQALTLLQDSERLIGRELNDAEEASLRSALASRAIQQAQAGVPVVDPVIEQLDSATQRRVRAIEEAAQTELARETESPITTALRKATPGAFGELLETPVEGVKAILGDRDEVRLDESLLSNIDDGIANNTEDLADSPFRTTNVFVGNEEDGYLNPLKMDVPRLNSVYDQLGNAGDTNNPVFKDMKSKRNEFSIVSDQIDQLYDGRKKLSKVDLSAYDKGNEAFDKGDREGLISAITDLKGEEAKLKDRFTLVSETHKNLKSPEVHRSAFDSGSDNVIFDLLGRGGDKITQQTDKINEVRQAIIDANNKAFGRRRMLELRLQRLDATVPPETDVPATVKRFSKQQSTNVFAGIDNVALNGLSGGTP